MENESIDASVVIGFRDWGQERLKLSVKSIIESFGSYRGEVIVSDYGSKDTEGLQQEIEALGARYVYTPSDGPWSRSRALNAGFARARGDLLICTDADMLFSPRAFERIVSIWHENAHSCLVLQCRDLPKGYSHDSESVINPVWDELAKVSRLRPRWGMGGMIAVSRSAFRAVQGLDERMHTYGAEDLDFAKRVQNSGEKVLWVEDPEVRMYHIYHPPTRDTITTSESVAVNHNKEILSKDNSLIRNVARWEYPLEDAPLVSVVISTFNRGDYISDSINSVLSQTFQNFEIIIVDDGSTDNTREVVQGFDDARIRYFYQENAGISRARNLGAMKSRGFYTAVHDDDDIMLPNRLENSLKAIKAGIRATFGSWINFDNATGELALYASKTNFNNNTIYTTGVAPGHPTWLLETSLIREFKYDESLTSAVDNNLALRLIRAGVKWAHTGEVMAMRRIHDRQVSDVDSGAQKAGAMWSNQMMQLITTEASRLEFRNRDKQEKWPEIAGRGKLDEVYCMHLPDHLVQRSVTISEGPKQSTRVIEELDGVDFILEVFDLEGNHLGTRARISNVKLADLASLRRGDFKFTISGTIATELDVSGLDTMEDSESHELKVSESHELKVLVSDALTESEGLWPRAAAVLVNNIGSKSSILESSVADRAVFGRTFVFKGHDGMESRSLLLGFESPEQAATEALELRKLGDIERVSIVSGELLSEIKKVIGSTK